MKFPVQLATTATPGHSLRPPGSQPICFPYWCYWRYWQSNPGPPPLVPTVQTALPPTTSSILQMFFVFLMNISTGGS